MDQFTLKILQTIKSVLSTIRCLCFSLINDDRKSLATSERCLAAQTVDCMFHCRIAYNLPLLQARKLLGELLYLY
jgi:hypothetical protein